MSDFLIVALLSITHASGMPFNVTFDNEEIRNKRVWAHRYKRKVVN
jgi:hypothetical protein